jgi:hypothetical protein
MSTCVIATILLSTIAAVFFALRTHMLKPETSGPAAPLRARASVFALSAVFAVHAQAVFLTGRVTPTEMFLAGGAAGYAVLLWFNLRFPTVAATMRDVIHL